MSQKNVFLRGEADRYFERNREELNKAHQAALDDFRSDPVLSVLEMIKPQFLLEIGCANGWRLDAAWRLWGSRGVGLDPSALAIGDGRVRFSELSLAVGTADEIPDGPFDCIVFGFCLYLCDRLDLFRIAATTDTALKNGGYIVVYDFCPASTYSNTYAHAAGVLSHKMDHSRLWSWHPFYVVWRHETTAHAGKSPDDPDERLAVTVLKKLCR